MSVVRLNNKADYDKQLGMGLFRESLTTPGSETKKALEKQRLEFGKASGNQTIVIAGLTPEQIEAGNRYKMAIGLNREKINSMALAGQVAKIAQEKSKDTQCMPHMDTIGHDLRKRRKAKQISKASFR